MSHAFFSFLSALPELPRLLAFYPWDRAYPATRPGCTMEDRLLRESLTHQGWTRGNLTLPAREEALQSSLGEMPFTQTTVNLIKLNLAWSSLLERAGCFQVLGHHPNSSYVASAIRSYWDDPQTRHLLNCLLCNT